MKQPADGSSDFKLCPDAAIRYEERELAIVQWCKKPRMVTRTRLTPASQLHDDQIEKSGDATVKPVATPPRDA